ncbi:hypothetical protein SAY86_018407 [Trapa natans]|uniref:NADH-plastoquinone oxidoreductase subunit K n=1 Tax=Trapa natans TaxID=22666 RepID=A0AAN7QY13_TRANT|nr:hypothetical protein SAY86_018407 [Trapa natans]
MSQLHTSLHFHLTPIVMINGSSRHDLLLNSQNFYRSIPQGQRTRRCLGCYQRLRGSRNRRALILGGMFSTDSYSTVRGVDKLIPIDVYLSGYSPKPEAVIDSITKLRTKISREIYEDQIRSQEDNRCFTTNHKLNLGRSTHTRNYDQRLLYQSPSTSEIPFEIFFKYKSSIFSHELVN